LGVSPESFRDLPGSQYVGVSPESFRDPPGSQSMAVYILCCHFYLVINPYIPP